MLVYQRVNLLGSAMITSTIHLVPFSFRDGTLGTAWYPQHEILTIETAKFFKRLWQPGITCGSYSIKIYQNSNIIHTMADNMVYDNGLIILYYYWSILKGYQSKQNDPILLIGEKSPSDLITPTMGGDMTYIIHTCIYIYINYRYPYIYI